MLSFIFQTHFSFHRSVRVPIPLWVKKDIQIFPHPKTQNIEKSFNIYVEINNNNNNTINIYLLAVEKYISYSGAVVFFCSGMLEK
jgi:hypothetical protein